MNQIKTLVFTAAVLLIGLVLFFQLPIEIKPNHEYPKLTISVSAYAYSPEMVERQIVSKIESAVSSLKGVRSVSSASYNGFGRVSVELQKSLSLNFMQFLVNDALSVIGFPENIYPVVNAYQPDEDENQAIISYRFYGDAPLSSIHSSIKSGLLPQLKSLEGVADVWLTGGSDQECFISLNEQKLKQLGLNISDISNVVNSTFQEHHFGQISQNTLRVPVKLNQSEIILEQLKALVVTRGNEHIRLDQIADVQVRFSTLNRIARFNGFASVTMEIYRKPSTNLLSVAEEIKTVVDGFRFPEGLALDLVQDKSRHVKNEFKSLGKRSIWSVLAVLAVLLLFSRNFREPLLLFGSIFIVLCMTFIWFYLCGLTINFLTLAGLALSFGMLVDTAIIMFEQFKLNDSRSVRQKVRDLVSPILASTLTTFIVLLPFVLLTDKLQEQYIPFAMAIMLSLFSSLIVSFFILPVAFKKWIKKENQIKKGSRLRRIAEPYLSTTLSYPKVLIFFFIWLIGFPVYLIENETWETLGLERFKSEINYVLGGTTGLFYNHVYKGESWSWGEETYLGVSVQMPFGSSLEQTNRIVAQIEQNLLREHQDIQVISNIGHESARMSVYFDEPNSATPYIVKSKAISMGANIGAATISVYGYGQGYSNGGGGTMPSFALKLKGYNYDQLKQFGTRLKTELETHRRIANIKLKSRRWGDENQSQFLLTLRREQLERYNFEPAQVVRELGLLVQTHLPRGNFLYTTKPIRLRFSTERGYLPLEHLLEKEFRQGNVSIPFKYLITLKKETLPDVILREEQQYQLLIAYDYKGPYRFGEKFTKAFLEKQVLPVGYTLEKSGWSLDKKDEQASLFAIGLAIVLIFLLCSALFESFKLGFITLLAVPASLCGIFVIYYISDQNFTLAARIGVILICGLTVNNAIVLTEEIRRLALKIPLERAIVEGTLNRLRPILMTTLTTLIGLIPLLIIDKPGGEDLWQTLSLTIIGGLSGSMVLVLLVFPAMNYVVLGSEKERAKGEKVLSTQTG